MPPTRDRRDLNKGTQDGRAGTSRHSSGAAPMPSPRHSCTVSQAGVRPQGAVTPAVSAPQRPREDGGPPPQAGSSPRQMWTKLGQRREGAAHQDVTWQ